MSRKFMSIVLAVSLVIGALVAPMVQGSNVMAETANCRKTKFASVKSAQKKYNKDLSGVRFASCANINIRTKFGKKKAVVMQTDDSAGGFMIYFKYGKSIYELGAWDRRINGISKDGTYIMTDMDAQTYRIWKYKKGCYKTITDWKHFEKDSDRDAWRKKVSKKYGINTIRFKSYSEKSSSSSSSSSTKKIPSAIYGVYNFPGEKSLILKYKKGILYLKGYYGTSWVVSQKRYKINKKYKISPNCKVIIRAETSKTISFKKYIKELSNMDGNTINYIGCKIKIKNMKITKLEFGD